MHILGITPFSGLLRIHFLNNQNRDLDRIRSTRSVGVGIVYMLNIGPGQCFKS